MENKNLILIAIIIGVCCFCLSASIFGVVLMHNQPASSTSPFTLSIFKSPINLNGTWVITDVTSPQPAGSSSPIGKLITITDNGSNNIQISDAISGFTYPITVVTRTQTNFQGNLYKYWANIGNSSNPVIGTLTFNSDGKTTLNSMGVIVTLKRQ